MKKTTTFLLSSFLFGCTVLQADDELSINFENFSAERMIASQDQGPFRISSHGDWISRTAVKKKDHHRGHLEFNEWDVEGSAVIYYNKEHEEGVVASVDYSSTHFKWNRNHDFNRKIFNQISLTGSFFSKRVCNWLWQAQATLNWDTKYNNFCEYTNYDLVLWGRYDYNPNKLGLHAGFLAQTGMKIDRIYPIIGFDWAFNNNWKLNLVFPVNMSLVYAINENWSASIAGRIFDIRRRVGKDAEVRKGLIEYRNKGVEAALSYESHRFFANVHSGLTFGGEFKISNRNHKRQHNYKLDSSGYVGGELALKF